MSFTVTKTYADGADLTEGQLDTAFESIETLINTTLLGTENIQAGAITSSLLATSAVGTSNIAAAAVTLAKLADEIVAKLVPTGTVLSYTGTSAPSGYLLADGSAVSRTSYAALFAVTGTAHGSGDGSTTFNLPDYRGRFLRGKDGSSGRDPDASSRTAMATGGATGDNIGSIQGHAYQTHTHVQDAHTHNSASTFSVLTSGAGSNVAAGAPFSIAQVNPLVASTTATNQDAAATGTHAQASANETRPVNAMVNYIIKT